MLNLSELSNFDYIVIVIIAISILFAFAKGFLASITHFLGWLISGYIVFKFYPENTAFLQEYFSSKIVVDILATLVLFVLLLIICSIASNFIINIISSFKTSFFDKFLGIIFGVFRGFVVCCVIFWSIIIIYSAINDNQKPTWLTKSQTYPYLSMGTTYIIELLSNETSNEKVIDFINKNKSFLMPQEKINELENNLQDSVKELKEEVSAKTNIDY